MTIRVSPDFERDLPAARAILSHEVRLIEYERQHNRSLSELELYRDAIARFDRD